MANLLDLYWRQILDDELSDDAARWPPSRLSDAHPVPAAPPALGPAGQALPPLVQAAIHRQLLLRQANGFVDDLLAEAQRAELAAGHRIFDFTPPGRPAPPVPPALYLVLEGEVKLIGQRPDPRVPELHTEEVAADRLPTVIGRLGAGSLLGLPQLAWALVGQLRARAGERTADEIVDLEQRLRSLRDSREAAGDQARALELGRRIERAHAAVRDVREHLVLDQALPTDYAVEVLPRPGVPDDRALVALRIEQSQAIELAARHPGFLSMVRQVNDRHFGRVDALMAAIDANPILRFLDQGRRILFLQLAASRRIPARPGLRPVSDTYLAADTRPGRVALVVRGQGQAFLPSATSGQGAPVLVGDVGPGELVGHERLFRPDELLSAHGVPALDEEPLRATDIYLEGDTEILEIDRQSLRWLLAGHAATRAAALEWYVAGGADETEHPARVVAMVADRPGLGLTTLAVGAAAALCRLDDWPHAGDEDDVDEGRLVVDRPVVLLDLQGTQTWTERWEPRGYRRSGPRDLAQLGPMAAQQGIRCLLPPESGPAGLDLSRLAVVWPEDLHQIEELVERLRVLPRVAIVMVSGFDKAQGLVHALACRLIGTGTTVVWLNADPTATYTHTPEYPEVLVRVDRVDADYRARAAALAGGVEEAWARHKAGAVHAHAAADATVRVLDDPGGATLGVRGDFEALLDGTLRYPLGRAMSRLARVLVGRSVGLALGGGGLWGAAQIALINELQLAGVPIDYIAGTSFGSVVGGLYAAGGPPALDRLLDDACPDYPDGGPWALIQTMRKSAFFRATTVHALTSTRAVQVEIDRIICATLKRATPLPLACTEVPFLPVSTNLDTCAPFTTMTGSVGFGVRASSGLPPALPGLWRHGQRILDGAMVANVPAEIVRNHGAHYVISANVIAPRTQNRFSSGRVSTLVDSTVGRVTDMTRGLFLLGWKAGDDQGRLRADYRVDLWTRGANMLGWWQGHRIVASTQERLFQEQVGWSIREHWERRTADGGSAYRRVRADVDVRVD